MFKWITIVLAVLWLLTAVIVGINIHRQYIVSKLQTRILNDYTLMSEVDDIFKNVQDSLRRDAEAAEKLLGEMKKPFPKEASFINWLVLRSAIIFLTLATIVMFWFYYRNKAKE